MLSAGIAGARSGMSSESDGSGRSDDIVIIKQLLQKLEEAAVRDAETPREAPLVVESATESLRQQPIVDEPFREGPPLLVLRSSRNVSAANGLQSADADPARSQGLPEFPRTPISIDFPPTDTALVTVPQEALPARRRPGIAVAPLSFVLGIVAAGGLIVAFDPFGQRGGGPVVARAPSVAAPSAPEKSTADRVREGGDGQSTRPASGSAPALAAAGVTASDGPAGAVSEGNSTNAESSRQETANAPVPAVAEAPAAQSAPAADKLGLRVASRIELKSGERRSFDVSVDAPPSEAQRLLVIFRQVPAWMTFSKGGAIGNDIWLLPAQQVRDLEVEVSDGASGAADVKVQLAKVDGSILSETSVSVVAVSRLSPPRHGGGIVGRKRSNDPQAPGARRTAARHRRG